MAENDTDAARNIPGAQSARFSWMASILTPTHERGMYLKFMEHVAPDARVPFVRIIVSLFGILGVLFFGLRFIFADMLRAKYVAVPAILLMLGFLLVLVIYMVSSRDGSMLASTFALNAGNIDERRRERKNLRLGTIGVKSIDKTTGLIHFENGDVGCVYAVKGQLSLSTLPEAADYIDQRRGEYETSRTLGGQELRITTIAPNDLSTQMHDLLIKKRTGERRADGYGLWCARMAATQRRYLNALMDTGSQLTLIQTVIIRDVDRDQLAKSVNAFETGCESGMYERYARITDPTEIAERLGGPTMMENHKEV